jgi:ubiquinone/menaquinone biosynthesis C-methylase UbiE/chorismate mutase
MAELLDLKELSKRLRQTDEHLISLLARRMSLSSQVGEYKRSRDEPIYRAEIEDERLADVEKWARKLGLNPHFARAVLYFAIDESCKVQMIGLQEQGEDAEDIEDVEAEYRALKQNLLRLTEKIASTYDGYGKDSQATRTYLDFEAKVLEAEIATLDDLSLAIDIGCATGRIALQVACKFERVVGYDISPQMIEHASAKLQNYPSDRVHFQVVDIEAGIPQADNSVSLVVVNLGTASDLRNIKQVLAEIQRVLKPGGKAFLSFYNADALLYRIGFLPWPVGMAAEINSVKHCLDVHYDGEVFQVYAKPYKTEEIAELIPEGMEIQRTLTYPTILSILPNAFEDSVIQNIAEIDRQLATDPSNSGAYLMVVSEKRH